jgi:hypothetical protein
MEPCDSEKCGICGQPSTYDNFIDLNICLACGAQQTVKGWEPRKPPKEKKSAPRLYLFAA